MILFIYFVSLYLYIVVVKCKYFELNNICKLVDNGKKIFNVCKYIWNNVIVI